MFLVEPDLDFGNIREALNVRRLFYYDCIEELPRPEETDQMFNERTASQRKLLSRVNEAALCHIRLGTLKQHQRRRGVSQKEVDVKIAVDMLTHAAGRSMDKAVLVTGDLDFRPVVESLVELGVIVQLAYDPRVTAAELQDAADLRLPLDIDHWHSFCTSKFRTEHPLPTHWHGDKGKFGTVWRQVKQGSFRDHPVRVWETQEGMFTVEIESYSEDGSSLCLQAKDRELLINRYIPSLLGTFGWH